MSKGSNFRRKTSARPIQKQVPFSGPVLGAALPIHDKAQAKKLHLFLLPRAKKTEATPCWSWWNAYEHAIPQGKRPLAINMDETAIKFYVQHRGLIVERARHVFRPKPTQQVSRAQQRTCVSHVAFVRNNAAAQPSLPQFFISSEHALRVGEV